MQQVLCCDRFDRGSKQVKRDPILAHTRLQTDMINRDRGISSALYVGTVMTSTFYIILTRGNWFQTNSL